MDGWAHVQELTRKIHLKGKEITPRARVLCIIMTFTERKKEREIIRNVEENERMSVSCLSGHREDMFRSRTGLLNAEIVFNFT